MAVNGVTRSQTGATNAEIRRDCDDALDRVFASPLINEFTNSFDGQIPPVSLTRSTNPELRYDLDLVMSWVLAFEGKIGYAPPYYVTPVVSSETRATNAELRNDLDVASAALTWVEANT